MLSDVVVIPGLSWDFTLKYFVPLLIAAAAQFVCPRVWLLIYSTTISICWMSVSGVAALFLYIGYGFYHNPTDPSVGTVVTGWAVSGLLIIWIPHFLR